MNPCSETTGRSAVGIDVGGTGVKAGVVDIATGTVVGTPIRLPTPHPARIEPVLDTVWEAFEGLAEGHPERTLSRLPLGVGLSGDVRDCQHTTGVNLHSSWIDAPARDLLEKRLKQRVHILNDADAAGIAEICYGAGAGVDGVVVLLTFGTGIGSAIFLDGDLLPNSGLGQYPFQGTEAERRLSAVARERRGLSWEQWAKELDAFLVEVELMLRPSLIIIGGGASEAAHPFWAHLRPSCSVVRAALGNQAGIVGAAKVAADRET